MLMNPKREKPTEPQAQPASQPASQEASQEASQAQPAAPSKGRKKRRPKDKAKQQAALALTAGHGLSQAQAAKLLGVTRSAISQRLRGAVDPAIIKEWKEKKADYLEAIQAAFIMSLTPRQIKDMLRRRGLVDFGIIFDKARIQRGEATDIVDFRGFLEHSLAELAARRQALEAQLARIEPVEISVSPADQASDSVSLAGTAIIDAEQAAPEPTEPD